MADAATTRNRLRKPEAGANLNIWAPLINEDGGSDRTDEALDGVCAFALSGSKTLSSTNYETDEARMRVINVTGGTGGTVTIPAVEKWYLVRNGTTGDVIISNGSNSLTLTPGEINAVFTNGTTIYAANSRTYVDAAILAASLTTQLPSQTGNAGKFIGTDGSVASWTAFTSSIVTTALGYFPTSITGLTGVQSASDVRSGLSLVIGTNVQAYSAALSSYAGINPSANVQTLLGAADFSAFRTSLGVAIGANVQAYNANLTTYAGIAPSANVQTLLGSANYAAFLSSLGGQASLISGTNIKTVNGSSLLGSGNVSFSGWNNSGAPVSTASGTSWTFSSIAATSNDLKFVFNGLSHSGGGTADLTMEVSDDNGSTWSAAQNLVSAANSSGVIFGAIIIDNYATAGGIGIVHHAIVSSTVEPDLRSGGANLMFHLAGGAINAVRFKWSGGETGDAGSIQMMVR